MENKNIDALEYLLKLKAEKKKKEPSKVERDQFCAAWVMQAASEGYSARMEKYLYNGLSYCGAKPFKEYIDQVEDKEKALNSLFSGKMYGTNADATFRLMVHLFALLLNDRKTCELASIVITRFPSACYNKDKKPLGNIDSILLKYFFGELDPTAQLIPLAEMGIKKPIFINEFISEMKRILQSIDSEGLSKRKVSNIERVRQWLEEYEGTKVSSDSAPAVISAKEVPSPVLQKTNATPPLQASINSEKPAASCPSTELLPASTQGERAHDNNQADAVPADLTAHFTELLSKVAKAASAIRAESLQQKSKIEILTLALENEQSRLQRANEQNAEYQETIAELRIKLASAEGTILALNQTVTQRDAVIAEKTAEIEERIKMADVLSRDRSKQADETLQRLASKIRIEYRDFMDAMDIPMSCDLGENLRLQLQSVFDILEKGGMKIK